MELLNLIPYGKENAISREDLSKLTGWDDRRVRDEIKRLMRNSVRAHYRRIHKQASGKTDIQGGE